MTNNEGLHNSKSAPTNVFKKFNKQNSVSLKTFEARFNKNYVFFGKVFILWMIL